MEFSIRKGTKEDLPEVLELIKELAEFEKAPDEVTITLEQLEEDGFGENPVYWVLVAKAEGQVVGISFYYIRYSTWKGRCLYLEDIVVKEQYRGIGIGKALFNETVLRAREMDAQLMVWQVLDWNKPAISFYEKYGAKMDGEWLNGRLSHEQIQNFEPA